MRISTGILLGVAALSLAACSSDRGSRALEGGGIGANYTPFERGNLDAGRINWLLGREIVAADSDFDPACYEAELRVDLDVVRASFSHVLGGRSDQ